MSIPENQEGVGLRGLLRYGEESGLSFLFYNTPETRESPEIPSRQISQGVSLGAAMGVESFRQLDHLFRQEGLKAAFGSPRKMVASDTTLGRVCGQIPWRWTKKALLAAWRLARREGLTGAKLPSGRDLRAGALDGSAQGGGLMSVLVELGTVITPIALGRIPKRGKELPISLALLRHTAKAEGRTFLTHLLLDGEYANEPTWRTCDDIGVAAVVKVKAVEAGRLAILKDAQELFEVSPLRPGVEHDSGVDDVRGCRYDAWAVADLPWGWDAAGRRLKVARIRERWFKGRDKGQTVEFWVLSQDAGLSALDLRELGH
ncbi:MAG: hypothetical protein L0191_12605, partial [Acidobacteria bacterium]|nr:hypothetical protein [Acidobacteriota bacterium]